MTAVKHITRINYKQKGEKGDPGEKGPTVRPRRFVPGVEYQAGGPGEEWLDYACYDGVWYRCMETHTPSTGQNPFDDIGHGYTTWQVDTNFDFVATKALFVGEDGQGWIADGGKLYHTSGKVTLTMDGTANFNNKCIITKEGEITATSGTFSGYIVAQMVTKGGDVTLTSEANIMSSGYLTLTLPISSSFRGRRILVVDSTFPPYTKTDLSTYTYIKVASGYLCGLGEYTDTSTPAYKQIKIRGGAIELVAIPYGDSVRWLVANGHECIIQKYV